jgi:hypothetical protein
VDALKTPDESNLSRTLLPIDLTSDKTHLSQSGKAKAWPLYLTIGNLPNDIRLNPENGCVQLVALLPVLSGKSAVYLK